MTSAPASTTGYHTFHPDVSINYQLNRFSDGTPASVAELTAAARRITSYPDYTKERLALSDAADAEGGPLASALYQRSAEFCMLPDDRAKIPPYRGTHLYAHRITPPAALGAVVMFGGFDSYLEELFAAQAYFVAAGYDAIVFEGPGRAPCSRRGTCRVVNVVEGGPDR